jgi:hypothetical protein
MTPMEIATYHGQTDIIDLLKKYGVPALEPRDAAQQRLIGAAEDHDIPAMEDAIDAGADINRWNRQGETALLVACRFFFGEVHQFTAIVYILGKGADPAIQGCDDTGSQPCHKTTALHCVMLESPLPDRCSQCEERVRSVIKALLQHRALVSARDSDGKTPLHIAAEKNNIVGAVILIDAGCEMIPKDNKGKTPLDYAESAEMIKLLKDHGAKEAGETHAQTDKEKPSLPPRKSSVPKINGYGPYKFGVTIEEAKKARPEASRTNCDYQDTAYCLTEKTDLFGQEAEIDAHFEKNTKRLHMVTITFKRLDDKFKGSRACMEVLEAIATPLVEKWGIPTREHGRSMLWESPYGGTLSLGRLCLNADVGVVVVSYDDTPGF